MRNQSEPEARAIELLNDARIVEAPVPVETLAIGLGADITYEPYDGEVSGMLVRGDDGGAVIGVNSKHAITRQRFSVAHEIAHLVLHTGKPMFIDRFVRVNWRDGSSDQEEVEANAFAAELLMPRELLAREVDKAIAKQQMVTPQQLAKQLAKVFQVSPEAMSYRLENLGVVDPVALIG
jgi:Zn-dependent peptidase ImmA (M78 family)